MTFSPDYWRCRTCGCLWRDNHDETVSLASANQKSCDDCEQEGAAQVCDPLYRKDTVAALVDHAAEQLAECEKRQAADRASALANYAKLEQAQSEIAGLKQQLEVLGPPARNYNRTLVRAEQAEAELARVKAEISGYEP